MTANDTRGTGANLNPRHNSGADREGQLNANQCRVRVGAPWLRAVGPEPPTGPTDTPLGTYKREEMPVVTACVT